MLVTLPPALEAWRQEIEQAMPGRVHLVRVPYDRARNEIRLPPDAPGRDFLRQLFLDAGFRGQFARAYALSVTRTLPEGGEQHVLLNGALIDGWADQEVHALIAHELGHGWLNACGYPSPPYQSGVESCIAIHAGDAVQHVLIREEAKRRGVSLYSYWRRAVERQLQEVVEGVETGFPATTPCEKLTQLGLWVDAALGVTEEEFPELGRLLAGLRQAYPEIEPAFQELDQLLRGRDLTPPEVYGAALGESLGIFASLHATLLKTRG